jgi:hypothetical protein
VPRCGASGIGTLYCDLAHVPAVTGARLPAGADTPEPFVVSCSASRAAEAVPSFRENGHHFHEHVCHEHAS